jgi:hypothetical protein
MAKGQKIKQREALLQSGCVAIYALCDGAGAIRYVGKAQNPSARLAQHQAGRGPNIRLNEWILSERARLRVLEWCSVADWKERERYWIAHFSGPLLFNISRGGSQPTVPERGSGRQRRLWEIKQALGLGLKKGFLPEDVKAKMRLAAKRAPHLFGAWSQI